MLLRAVPSGAYPHLMDPRSAARRWSGTWERVWREPGPVDLTVIYAEDAVLQSHAPHRPPNYIEPALAAQPSTKCEFDEPLVDGNRAAVTWRAEPRLKAGGRMLIEGVSMLRFNSEGLVVEQRDFWGSTP
jgi:SnoaL-like domain